MNGGREPRQGIDRPDRLPLSVCRLFFAAFHASLFQPTTLVEKSIAGAAMLVISSCQTDDGHQFNIDAALDNCRDFARQQVTVTKAA